MREPIENEYFNWLSAKVLDVGGNIYTDLLRILHTTEFVWVIAGDKNRAEDGVELREDFCIQSRWAMRKNREWASQPASVLEVLISLAQRANFQTDMPVREWFWIFIANLELDDFRHVSESDESYIRDILEVFIWRTYEPNGSGGIFPLRWPHRDQREVEIWYQFCDFVEEEGLL